MNWLRSLMLILFATSAFAQQAPVRRVSVSVTSINNNVVSLDRGRQSGIEVGDRVRLFPAAAPIVEASVLSVRENACRVQLTVGSAGIDPGTTGEVLVATNSEYDAPLPWTAPAEDFDSAKPLLIGRASSAEERAPRSRARVFFQSEWSKIEGSESADYLFGSLGVDLAYENPFGNGGRLHFNADVFSRTANLDLGFDVDDSRLRFDRFSYAWGGTRERANRWQVGRFLHYEFPELGVIDGVEYAHRLDSGSRVGGSVGYQPQTLEDFRTTNDLQASVFYRHISGKDGELALGASYQKTWHEGEADRDLVLATLDYHPSRNWTIWGTSWVDVYGSDAVNKDSGPELTQLIGGVTWTDPRGHGATVSLTDTRWPELLRDLYVSVDPNLLANGHVKRIRAQGWTPLNEYFRLRASVDHWTDQDDSGSGGELFLGARDLLWKRGELSAAVYLREGKFEDLVGVRLTAFKNTDFGSFRGTVDNATSDGTNFGGDVSEGQLRLRGSWDRNIGLNWYLSLYVQTVSIENVDTSALGFHLQWSH